MDISSKQKINKEILSFNDKLDQMDIINIYRNFYGRAPEYTFFSSAHEAFLRIDHMLRHKTSLNKFNKIEITSSIFSDYALKLKINQKNKQGKSTNMWKFNNMLLNNDWVKEQIKELIKRYLEMNENDIMTSKFGGYSKSGNWREVCIISGLPQETRKFQINYLTFQAKELAKEEQAKHKVTKRKKIIKITIESETKKTIEKLCNKEVVF